MKTTTRLIAIAAVAAIAAALAPQSAEAQLEGYQFGVGINYADGQRCDGRRLLGLPIAPTPRIDQPPFFALYPPVYYDSTIVARPYGVSPFAPPPGIVPVEMSAPQAQVQKNPYYVEPEQKAKNQNEANDNDTAWIQNPWVVTDLRLVARN